MNRLRVQKGLRFVVCWYYARGRSGRRPLQNEHKRWWKKMASP